jgi:hypothetical protein
VLAAMALVRAGTADGARVIAQQVLAAAGDDDPELVHLLADYHVALGEFTAARLLLQE